MKAFRALMPIRRRTRYATLMPALSRRKERGKELNLGRTEGGQ